VRLSFSAGNGGQTSAISSFPSQPVEVLPMEAPPLAQRSGTIESEEIAKAKVRFHHGSRTVESLHDLVDEPVTVKSKMSLSRPQTHRLPTAVIWSITLVVPVIVALINYAIVLSEHFLKGDVKFRFMQDTFSCCGAIAGAFALAGISALYAGVATCLVTYLGPVCAGSGLPEAKGYLNGNALPLIFDRKILVVRIIGITLACASSFPVGREGPMVAIGGTVGYQAVKLIAFPFVRRWVNVHTQGDECDLSPALIVDEERFAHAKRIGCALGGAAGIACAFNAPIGGIMYMFEEVTVTSWPPELTFRVFVCTVLAAMLSRGFLNITHSDVHHLVIFDQTKAVEDNNWNWADVPFFILLSIFVGFFSAFFARAMLWTWGARDRFKKSIRCKKWKREIKALEVVAYAAFCALMFALVPMLIECAKEPVQGEKLDPNDLASYRRLETGGLRFVQHDCPDGEHREAGTLLLTGAEEAVKHLFSRHTNSQMDLYPLLLSVILYSVLACGMPGLPIPMGCFVPCLLIGAMIGRLVGEAAKATNMDLAHPGVYALVGSASMLSGFTHMTIAIVVLLVEAAADLSLVAPMMLGILLASLASKWVNHHAYDEVLILRKGVPFLDAEVPHEMDNDGSTAGDLCDEYPEECQMLLQAEAHQVMAALDWGKEQGRGYAHFPVVENGRCVGLTSRTRLEATVTALRKSGVKRQSSDLYRTQTNLMGTTRSGHLADEDKALGIQRFVSGLTVRTPSKTDSMGQTASGDGGAHFMVPVHRIMDRSPYTILEDMPAPRFYPLFIKAGVSAAAVVSKSGDFLGVLTRNNLISQSRETHMPEPQRQNTAAVRERSEYGSEAPPKWGSEEAPRRQVSKESFGSSASKFGSKPGKDASSSAAASKNVEITAATNRFLDEDPVDALRLWQITAATNAAVDHWLRPDVQVDDANGTIQQLTCEIERLQKLKADAEEQQQLVKEHSPSDVRVNSRRVTVHSI